MRALGREAWVWQPTQPFVARSSAPRALVTVEADGCPELLLVAAERAGSPVVGAKLAAVNSTAKVP